MRAFSLFYGALVAKAGCVSVVLLLAFGGCGPQDENPSVAEVGDRAITAQDVRAFIDRLPENAGGEGAGKEQLRDHLQTIIDFELMLMEARSQGIDGSSAYLSRMDRIRKAKLVGEYEGRWIDATLGPGEVEEYIERENLARAIKLADILVADLETAEQAVREIESGASFADVARKLSMNEQTAARGGDSGRFGTRDQLVPSLAEELFGLEVGSVSDPVRIGNRYAVFKILDDTTAQLNRRQLTKIAENLQREKYRIAKAELVAELTDQYSLEPVPDGCTPARGTSATTRPRSSSSGTTAERSQLPT